MVLSSQVEWALHCCSVLAGAGPEQTLATKTLAEFHGVPKEYLSKALQLLAKAGLVEGTLGPTGGYRLARLPSKITFLDIVEAVEGNQRSFRCQEIRGNNPCLKKSEKKFDRVCAVARVMYKADEAWRKELSSVTLEDLNRTLQRDVSAEVLDRAQKWFEGQR
jgi:Rrf2 family protein